MSTNNAGIQQNSVLKCPRCEFNIPMDTVNLLSYASAICPLCCFKLAIEQDSSEEGLTALYHLKNGLDRIRNL